MSLRRLPCKTQPVDYFNMKISIFLGILFAFFLVNSTFAFIEDYEDLLQNDSYESRVTDLMQNLDSKIRGKREVHKNETKTVCYDGVGCFDSAGPFKTINALPESPLAGNTHFWYWPPIEMNRPDPIVVPFDNMDRAKKWLDFGFDVRLPTKMLVHGFGSNCSLSWTTEYKRVFRRKRIANLICLDWSRLTHLPHYILSLANGRVAAKQTAMFLEHLKRTMGLRFEDLHLLGFSLGAHVAGAVGAYVKNLGRITGLDPSGPVYEGKHPAVRLDPTDALFVDVIHTNTESIIHGGMGSTDQMGHADFYPNGGKSQFGCNGFLTGAAHDFMSYVGNQIQNFIPSVVSHEGITEWLRHHVISSQESEGSVDYEEAGRPGEEHNCNHKRGNRYFIDSIEPDCHFTAFLCNTYEDFLAGNCFSCVEGKCCEMGYRANKTCPSGRLFLKTRTNHPFCGYQYLFNLEVKPDSVPLENFGNITVKFLGVEYQNEEFIISGDADEHMIPVEETSLKQIVVLSSAVTRFVRISINYHVPNKSLPHITLLEIHRLSIMDPYGKVFSSCNTKVYMDVPQIISLYPGKCIVSFRLLNL